MAETQEDEPPAGSEGLVLKIERVLPATRPVVFNACTNAEELAKWWGPEGYRVTNLEFEPGVGESYRIKMQPPEGDPFHLAGEFREVDPPTRLAFTFRWEDPDPDDVETIASLSFHDREQGTEVVLSQGPFKTGARLELHRGGWTESLDKLEALLA